MGGNVAGNIDDLLRTRLGHGGDNGGLKALAGRVYHNHIRAKTVPDKTGKQLLCRTAAELRIGDAVAHRIGLGVFNGLRHDLNAQHPAAMAGQHQRNGACAAVYVADVLVAAQISEIQREAVEHLRLYGIYLEKAGGVQLKDGAA